MKFTGYLSAEYAEAFKEFGQPLFLEKAGGWLLKRAVPNTQYSDAMGLYPLFGCKNWQALDQDLQQIANQLVSLVLVTDVFNRPHNKKFLEEQFDLVTLFKNHYVVDFNEPLPKIIHPRHRTYARKALKELKIEKDRPSPEIVTNWIELYRFLIKRHHITGIVAFSTQSFKQQFKVPGLHIFSARFKDAIVSMQLWFGDGQYAYYHLGASNELGYRFRASYGLMWFALHYFQQAGYQMADLGASAGLQAKKDGLSQFKAGWSNLQLPAYLCGRIFNTELYFRLSQNNATMNSYFPAYRMGEFSV